MKRFRIAIVGCGNMGLAYAKSFIHENLVLRDQLLLIEKSADRQAALTPMNMGRVLDGPNAEVSDVDALILAVKPQDFPTVPAALKPLLRPQQLVISIMAGVPIPYLQQELSHYSIVRAMPNTPALLGLGMTGFAAAPGIGVDHIRLAENLMNATGRAVFFEDESLLDAVTALSGSGPAYFYYFVKCLVEAGKEMGFDESLATMLVKQTMHGAYHLINSSDKTLDELIQAVASRGGTTEAALRTFGEQGLREALIDGVKAAEQRSRELSQTAKQS